MTAFKQVRMRSAKWTVLKSGARLVDAPGVRDDNSARDGIVKGFLKEADSIWIVSHIRCVFVPLRSIRGAASLLARS